ncbi:AfsR/SARP family transcriptional regulator [Saccharothrix obliqua]|uniref:AfsR/SARP family transcriptional regulator n=1 Tax=Saccharothrix obliqua TaxID=2861747 RepID=UPI001C5EA29C|nr:BTAD domain-containing putative transcriptional regulator [Saccharothrix obliqua]MBW4717279.1 tetratricopeptide repeat protein [Saccharothrix obliqua]
MVVVEFGLLGGVWARRDGDQVDLGHRRQRGVLGVLLAEANRPVPVEQLLDRVWGEQPPRRGRDTLYSYLTRLRGVLADLDGVRLERHSGGYRLALEERTADLHRFHDLLTRARATRDDHQALGLYEQALDLCRGEPLPELDTPWAADLRTALERHRQAAELDHTDTALRLGRHTDLLPALTERAGRHPLDERLAGQLMLALYRNGRQADALDHYQQLRTRLADELGTDPGPPLQQLHHRILTADPGLAEAEEGADRSRVVPRQLPAVPRLFTGRATELAELDRALTTTPDDVSGATVVISSIGGTGGIGKTWLALTWANRWVDRFPDGQLFVDLHGFSAADEPVEPAVALRGFLDALGVEPDRIPTGLDAQAALYRSLVAGRRMLVVLDNAATVDQVVPLLPGSPTCTVLVTSRHRLASLIDRHGARHLNLDILTRDEARALLTARLGTHRVGSAPRAVDELIRLCGGHSLALAITARNVGTRPTAPLAEVAAELRELGLEALDHDTDPSASLPTVLSWSLRRLTEEQRTLFALLGIAPGPDTTAPAVAALGGLPPATTRRTLTALEEASMLERRPGGRYAMHDLIRAYAATLGRELPEHVRRAALVRVLDFRLHTAVVAGRLLNPHRPLADPGPLAPGVRLHPLPDIATAMAWLDAEHATLLATQRTAAALGCHRVVWHLAWALHAFHLLRGHRHDALATWRAALDAADHLPDPATRSRAHRHLGTAYSRLRLHEQAVPHLEQSLALARQHRDPVEHAHAHDALAIAWERRGDDRRALEHARQALDLFRAVDHPVWEAKALNAVGWYAARLGEYDTAHEHCHASLTLFRHHGYPEGEADALDSLGFIAHRTGDHHQALDHYRQALALRRALNHTYDVANILDHLAHPHAALGHRRQARAAWREALQLYREQGRDEDAAHTQRQLDDLDRTGSAETP